MTRERNAIEDYDFDLRLMQFASEGFAALDDRQDKDWQRYINRAKEITEWTDELMESGWETIVMLDRIDESWDGTDSSVVIVMALMHACVELTANSKAVRPLVFLRENVFEHGLFLSAFSYQPSAFSYQQTAIGFSLTLSNRQRTTGS